MRLFPRREGLRVETKARRPPRDLRSVEARVRLLHTFAHHELQAAELMAWAILAFPEAPLAFRRGLAGIAREELAHLALYEERLRELGSAFGALPVRDWFWSRVPQCAGPQTFVACLGVGFEGGNLDHAAHYEQALRDAGDEASARLQARIGTDEIRHVRFAASWFGRFGGRPLDFESWIAALPAPLTPLTMHRKPLARDARAAAGLPVAFLDALEAWSP